MLGPSNTYESCLLYLENNSFSQMMELRAGWIKRFLLPVPDPTFRMECLALFKKEEGEGKEDAVSV